MQEGDEANLGAQVLGIGRDHAQGLGRGVKQKIVDHGLILVGDDCNGLGQRKDHVEIRYRNKVGLAIVQPLCTHQGLALRAVAISATVEGNAQVTTGIALLDVSAEHSSTATLDRTHDTALSSADGCRVLLTVSRPGVAKDVRHLEPGGTHQ